MGARSSSFATGEFTDLRTTADSSSITESLRASLTFRNGIGKFEGTAKSSRGSSPRLAGGC
jgi:hypothetical protein